MGYSSTLLNRSGIEPPIKWSDVTDKEYADPSGESVIFFNVEEENEETPEGTLLRKVVSGIGTYEDSCKMYDWEKDMLAVWTMIHAAGSKMTGYIARYGEDSTDIERAIELDGKLAFQKAEIRWPDGNDVEANY